jgi:hypothetical protein
MNLTSIGVTVLAALVWIPAPAQGFVRSVTSTGTPIGWQNRCTELVLDSHEHPDFPHQRLRGVLDRAMAAWNSEIEGCTVYSLSLAAATVSGGDVDYDDKNVVLWRLPGFCDEPDNQLEDVCLSPNAAAITTVFYIDKPGDSRDGELVEADIVINANDFDFTDDGSADLVDLVGVMTHELGHYMGLNHTCASNLGTVPPVDSLGQEVPSCFPLIRLGGDITEATMFNFVEPGETKKRTPLEDEWRGICAIYADHSAECTIGTGCGCNASEPITVGWWLLAVGMMIVLLRRRPS